MWSDEEEQDVYVGQLQEVFDSCNTTGTGQLNRQQLTQLCGKLQLHEQADALVEKLLGEDPEARVGFDDFKEGFVSVLSETVEEEVMNSDNDDDEEEDEEGDEDFLGDGADNQMLATMRLDDPEDGDVAQPAAETGDRDDGGADGGKGSGKKYGRRSRPETDTEADYTSEFSEADVSLSLPTDSPPPRVRRPRRKRSNEWGRRSNESGEEKRTKSEHADDRVLLSEHSSGEEDNRAETFEAEGQMNQSIADMENALDPVSEEQHLRSIWQELGVGKDGYLVLHELAAVCQHIGMDEMNHEELEHLFNKLDVDTDGRVSFQEFLQGLFQHGGPTTPSVTPVRPLSTPRMTTPRMKLRLSASVHSVDHDRQTPSLVAIGSGLFSVLDLDHTGYATADAIIELWDNLGVPQGAEILEYLQFDLNTKVNLADLTFAMEQELRGLEEDNATYQASIVSYQQELRHLKTSHDSAVAERDKFKADLAEANNRNLILVKEGDDRQAAMERSREKELLTVETKYQEQIKGLQGETDHEREVLIHQSTKQRQKLDSEIAKLKEEEVKLKEKLTETQEELETLETEIQEMSERCSDLERHNIRQQKELDTAAEIHQKYEEMETNREKTLTEEHQFYEQKLKQVETDKMELKDKNDELTMEVEDLKQQLSSQRRQRRSTKKGSSSDSPQRSGSILSDYAKPTIVSTRDSEEDPSDNSEEDGEGPPRRRRRLPDRPSDSDIEPEKVEQLQQEKDQLQEEQQLLQEKIQQLQQDVGDMERAFKQEVTDLETAHEDEKKKMADSLQRDMEALEESLTRKLGEQEEEMRAEHEKEKQDLLIRSESEKNLLTQNYAEEKADLIARMKTEMEEELETKLQQQKKDYDLQLEEMVSHDREDFDRLKKQKVEMELKMKLQREEIQLEFEQERARLQEEVEKERIALEEKHRLQIYDYENIFSKGKEGLKGRLKEDFDSMVEQHRTEVEQMERQKMEQQLVERWSEMQQQEQGKMEQELEQHKLELEQVERRRMQQELEQHRVEVEQAERHKMEQKVEQERIRMDREVLLMSGKDKERLEGQQQADLRRLEQTFQEQLQSERSQLQLQLQEEREEWERERETLRENMEEETSRDVQTRLEEEFLEQIQRLKGAFDEERQELETRVRLLQEEVDDLGSDHSNQQLLRQQTEGRTRNLESKYRRQLEELKRTNSNLILEKRLMEEDHISRYRSLEERLQQLMLERDELCQSVSVSQVQGSPQGHGSFLEEFDREKNILMAIESQKHLLENKTRELRQQIQSLESSKSSQQHSSLLQHAHDKLVAEKQSLEESVKAMEAKLREMLDETLAAERYKAELGSWEVERDALKQQLDLTTDKLAETNAALAVANSEHVREVQTLREHSSQMVNMTKYNNLNLQCVETQRRVSELEAALEQRAAETSKLIMASQEDHKRILKELETERDNVRYKLGRTQALLDEQVQKLRLQLEKTARTDLLVKDLYVENSNLVKCLELTEKREKEAESKLFGAEEKCRVLGRLVRQVCPAVMS